MEINPSRVEAFQWMVVRSAPTPIVVMLMFLMWKRFCFPSSTLQATV